jgi:multiple antibiotic resistance protein
LGDVKMGRRAGNAAEFGDAHEIVKAAPSCRFRPTLAPDVNRNSRLFELPALFGLRQDPTWMACVRRSYSPRTKSHSQDALTLLGKAERPVHDRQRHRTVQHWQIGGQARMRFELSYGDIGILFFLTLGPLKAILPFARATRGTEPAFQRAVAWRATAIATAVVVVVALFGPLVLTNWHVSPPAIAITCGIILFYQALRIIMQTPGAMPGPASQQPSPSPPSSAIAVFPIAIPALVTAPGIAALAAVTVLYRHDLAYEAVVVALLLGVMLLNLLTLLNTETILKHGLAGVLPVVGWVLAVLQAALAVQMVIASLRALEVLHWPAS